MKKLTAILLSLVLALSLAVPALAAPADGVYTVDGEPVPTYAPGGSVFVPVLPEASPDEVLGIIGGADIRIIADGSDEQAAVDSLVKLVESAFAE